MDWKCNEGHSNEWKWNFCCHNVFSQIVQRKLIVIGIVTDCKLLQLINERQIVKSPLVEPVD